jgi:hypothetical protein
MPASPAILDLAMLLESWTVHLRAKPTVCTRPVVTTGTRSRGLSTGHVVEGARA